MPCRRVLIVDDDRDIRDGLTLVLESAGYETRAVADGRDALALFMLREWMPDVVVLDLMMPDVNGQTVLRALQRMPGLEDVRVVVLTASRDLTDSALAFARKVMKKPCDADELIESVEQAAA